MSFGSEFDRMRDRRAERKRLCPPALFTSVASPVEELRIVIEQATIYKNIFKQMNGEVTL